MSWPDLSPQEQAILRLLAEGNGTSEIAKRLSMSYRAVAGTISAIKGKTGEADVTELFKHYNNIT